MGCGSSLAFTWDFSQSGTLDALATGGDACPVLDAVASSALPLPYGQLELLLCLIGRGEFDADVPSADVLERARVAAHCSHALAALSGLVARNATFAAELAAHRWAAHDVCFAAARGVPGATSLLRVLYGASVSGAAAVVAALETEAAARQMRYRVDAPEGAVDVVVGGSSLPSAVELDALRAECARGVSGSCSAAVDPGDSPKTPSEVAFEAEVQRLTRAAMCAYQTMPSRVWPASFRVRARAEQLATHEKLRLLKARLESCSPETRVALNREMTALVMDVAPAFVDAMVESGVFAESKAFSERFQREDAELRDAGEFQAGRNAWACYGLQLVLLRGVPVACTDAVYAYSLLYPRSDNVLDDPAMTRADKSAFQRRFRAWLRSGVGSAPPALAPKDVLEAKVAAHVTLVESSWPRCDANANVFHSLVAINDAQTRSLGQHMHPRAARYDTLLEATAYKGGTSVLADLYVCAGPTPSRAEAAYAFYLGVALQIVDDLQDVAEDAAAQQQTLFTVPWVLRGLRADAGALRMCHLMHAVLENPPGSAVQDGPDRVTLARGKRAMCFVIALKAVMRAQPMFSDSFVAEAEARCPIPREPMSKLAGMRTLMRLVKQDAI